MAATDMNPIGVMQIVDTLETGGAERVAVNIANYLPRERYAPYLCTTRRDGALEASAASRRRQAPAESAEPVRHRRGPSARKVHQGKTTSEFFTRTAHRFFYRASLPPLFPASALIWHDHFGRCGTEERPAWLYKIALTRANGVIAVNTLLADWSRSRLSFPADRVWYVPNFVSTTQ